MLRLALVAAAGLAVTSNTVSVTEVDALTLSLKRVVRTTVLKDHQGIPYKKEEDGSRTRYIRDGRVMLYYYGTSTPIFDTFADITWYNNLKLGQSIDNYNMGKAVKGIEQRDAARRATERRAANAGNPAMARDVDPAKHALRNAEKKVAQQKERAQKAERLRRDAQELAWSEWITKAQVWEREAAEWRRVAEQQATASRAAAVRAAYEQEEWQMKAAIQQSIFDEARRAERAAIQANPEWWAAAQLLDDMEPAERREAEIESIMFQKRMSRSRATKLYDDQQSTYRFNRLPVVQQVRLRHAHGMQSV